MKKHRHKPRFRFQHDIIPIDWSFGDELTISNNESFILIVWTVYFAKHMWQFTFMRLKGYYIRYDPVHLPVKGVNDVDEAQTVKENFKAYEILRRIYGQDDRHK